MSSHKVCVRNSTFISTCFQIGSLLLELRLLLELLATTRPRVLGQHEAAVVALLTVQLAQVGPIVAAEAEVTVLEGPVDGADGAGTALPAEALTVVVDVGQAEVEGAVLEAHPLHEHGLAAVEELAYQLGVDTATLAESTFYAEQDLNGHFFACRLKGRGQQRWVIAFKIKIQLRNTFPIILNCVIGIIN